MRNVHQTLWLATCLWFVLGTFTPSQSFAEIKSGCVTNDPFPGGTLTCDDTRLPGTNSLGTFHNPERIHVYIKNDFVTEITDCTGPEDDGLTNNDIALRVQSVLQRINDTTSATPFSFEGFVDPGIDYCTATGLKEPTILLRVKPCAKNIAGQCVAIESFGASGRAPSVGCTSAPRTWIDFFKYYVSKNKPSVPENQCPGSNGVVFDNFQESISIDLFDGYVVSGTFDYTLLHELGHNLGFSHTHCFDEDLSGVSSIMTYSPYRKKDNHLQQYENECWEQYWPRTYVTPRYHYVNKASGVNWTPPILVNEHSYNTEKGLLTPGRISRGSYVSTQDYPATTGDYYIEASTSPFSSSAMSSFNTYYPASIFHHVDENTLVALHSPIEDPGLNIAISLEYGSNENSQHPPLSVIQMQRYRWDNGGIIEIDDTLDYCVATLFPASSCGMIRQVRARVPVVPAWDPRSGITVYATVQNSGATSFQNRRVLLHPGWHNTTTLRQAYTLKMGSDIKVPSMPSRFPSGHEYQGSTNFAPGIACDYDNTVYPYNCILAWSDTAANGMIMYTYFRVKTTLGFPDNTYSIEFLENVNGKQEVFTLFDNSVGHLAVAFTDGTFRIASKVVNSAGSTFIRSARNNSGNYSEFNMFDVLIPRQKWILSGPTFHYTNRSEFTGMTLGWVEY